RGRRGSRGVPRGLARAAVRLPREEGAALRGERAHPELLGKGERGFGLLAGAVDIGRARGQRDLRAQAETPCLVAPLAVLARQRAGVVGDPPRIRDPPRPEIALAEAPETHPAGADQLHGRRALRRLLEIPQALLGPSAEDLGVAQRRGDTR